MDIAMERYVINNTGFIPYLGINGPVVEPVEIEDLYALKMIKEGYALERVNPFNTAERVPVTVENFDTIVFETTRYEAYKRELAFLEGREYIHVTPVTKDNKEEKEEKDNKKEEKDKEPQPAPFNKKK